MHLITWRYLLLAAACQFTITAFSQSDTLFYFFDKEGKSCKSKDAAYVGFGIKENGAIRFTNYTVPEGLPVVEGHFTDSTLSVKSGYFKNFDPPGYIMEEGMYKKDSKEGYWLIWNKNGQVEDSEFYQHGNLLLNIHFAYNQFGLAVSRIANNEVQAKKELTEWFDNGKTKIAAVWIQGDGDSYHYNEEGTLTSVDTYEKGKITLVKYYKKDGTQMNDDEVVVMKKELEEKIKQREKQREAERMREPSFPGGPNAFWTYLQENIRIPSSIFNQLPDRSVKLSFTLNATGSAENIKILDNGSSDIRKTIVDVLNRMPRWDMKGNKSYGPLIYTFNIQGSLSQF